MKRPTTKYVTVGGAEVAYQVLGAGPRDLIWAAGSGHIDMRWESPVFAEYMGNLASMSRLILFDRRGTGASEALSDDAFPTWEDWSDDVRAVLDAAESDRAVVFGEVDGGGMATFFAATHPERVSALILANTTARMASAPDYPIGIAPEVAQTLVEAFRSTWGTADFIHSEFPSRVDDPEFVAWGERMLRAAATPKSQVAQLRYSLQSFDARAALPLIQASTLVIHNQNLFFPVAMGRYLADHIDGAKFVELPDADLFLATSDKAMAEIAEFVTGSRPAPEIDRLLTTVLFTDIVGSTQRAVDEGDQRWSKLLDAHHKAVRWELKRYGGTEIDTAGDGFFVTFDGPARAIRCACAIRDSIDSLGLQIRAGVHTGEVERSDQGLRGLAIHIGARVGAAAGAGEVLVSRTVADLVAGSGITLSDRGEYDLKGVPGAWQLFAVEA
jgi:class 3 adenylate cyclase